MQTTCLTKGLTRLADCRHVKREMTALRTCGRLWFMVVGGDHVVLVEMPQDGKPQEWLSKEHLMVWLQPVVGMSSSTMGVDQCTAPMSGWCMHGLPWLAWSSWGPTKTLAASTTTGGWL